MTGTASRLRLSRRRFLQMAGATSAATVAAAACTGSGLSLGGLAGPSSAPAQSFPDDRRVRVQHLLRRAGFAPSEEDVQQTLQLSEGELLGQLLDPTRPDALPPELQSLAIDENTRPRDLVAWWLGRMAVTRRPALEKLTFFWHGFHTSGFDKLGLRGLPLLYQQNLFQRDNAYARFADILKGISRQPAMILYLDLQTNVKGHPNENFARELMELFSMGLGTYSEDDVREASRAFTGYGVDRQTGSFVLRQRLHDTGPKTFLGQTGNFSGDEVIDIIMQQPATPRFVARKLWSFFAYPNPEDSIIEEIARAFSDSGGDIAAVVRAIFTHPAFYSGKAYRAQVKGPVDLMVGAARQLPFAGLNPALARWLPVMGQVPFSPPNVAGWPGGVTWLTGGALLGRANAVNAALSPGRRQLLFGSISVAEYLERHRLATAGALVDHLLTLLADGQVQPASRAALVDYLTHGQSDSMPLSALTASEQERRVRGVAYLIMAGPEYQLA